MPSQNNNSSLCNAVAESPLMIRDYCPTEKYSKLDPCMLYRGFIVKSLTDEPNGDDPIEGAIKTPPTWSIKSLCALALDPTVVDNDDGTFTWTSADEAVSHTWSTSGTTKDNDDGTVSWINPDGTVGVTWDKTDTDTHMSDFIPTVNADGSTTFVSRLVDHVHGDKVVPGGVTQHFTMPAGESAAGLECVAGKINIVMGDGSKKVTTMDCPDKGTDYHLSPPKAAVDNGDGTFSTCYDLLDANANNVVVTANYYCSTTTAAPAAGSDRLVAVSPGVWEHTAVNGAVTDIDTNIVFDQGNGKTKGFAAALSTLGNLNTNPGTNITLSDTEETLKIVNPSATKPAQYTFSLSGSDTLIQFKDATGAVGLGWVLNEGSTDTNLPEVDGNASAINANHLVRVNGEVTADTVSQSVGCVGSIPPGGAVTIKWSRYANGTDLVPNAGVVLAAPSNYQWTVRA